MAVDPARIYEVIGRHGGATDPVDGSTQIQRLDAWDSIVMVAIIAELADELSVRVPVPIIAQSKTVQEIVDYICAQAEA